MKCQSQISKYCKKKCRKGKYIIDKKEVCVFCFYKIKEENGNSK